MKTNLSAWSVADADYPEEGTSEEKLGFMLRYAILAPSSHNTQPWRFCVHANTVDVYADRTRALPVADPDERELIMSCGAALYHLRTAIHYFGHTCHIELFPDLANPSFLASIRLGFKADTETEDILLFQAIPKRRTNRHAYAEVALPPALIEALQKEARSEGCWLRPIDYEDERYAVAELVDSADHIQWANPAFRKELASWLQPNKSEQGDGIPGYAEGLGDLASAAGPLVVRTFNLGNGRAARDREIALHSPFLAVLGSEADTPGDWLMAGQALARVLLRARIEDVWGSFLNQALEVPETRTKLTELLDLKGAPQILLRLGFATEVPPTPRRPLSDVLTFDRHASMQLPT